MSLLQNYGQKEIWVNTAQNIYEAFNLDTAAAKINVAPGTYDFTGITNAIILRDNKHIELKETNRKYWATAYYPR
jgi:hypothetical protein